MELSVGPTHLFNQSGVLDGHRGQIRVGLDEQLAFSCEEGIPPAQQCERPQRLPAKHQGKNGIRAIEGVSLQSPNSVPFLALEFRCPLPPGPQTRDGLRANATGCQNFCRGAFATCTLNPGRVRAQAGHSQLANGMVDTGEVRRIQESLGGIVEDHQVVHPLLEGICRFAAFGGGGSQRQRRQGEDPREGLQQDQTVVKRLPGEGPHAVGSAPDGNPRGQEDSGRRAPLAEAQRRPDQERENTYIRAWWKVPSGGWLLKAYQVTMARASRRVPPSRYVCRLAWKKGGVAHTSSIGATTSAPSRSPIHQVTQIVSYPPVIRPVRANVRVHLWR